MISQIEGGFNTQSSAVAFYLAVLPLVPHQLAYLAKQLLPLPPCPQPPGSSRHRQTASLHLLNVVGLWEALAHILLVGFTDRVAASAVTRTCTASSTRLAAIGHAFFFVTSICNGAATYRTQLVCHNGSPPLLPHSLLDSTLTMLIFQLHF